MNERIKELAEQASLYARSDNSSMLFENYHNRYTDKFAQLIGWEAIGVCQVNVDALTGPFLSEYEKGVVEGYRRANENLRVYFGVEE